MKGLNFSPHTATYFLHTASATGVSRHGLSLQDKNGVDIDTGSA